MLASERVVVASFLALIFSLLLIAQISSSRSGENPLLFGRVATPKLVSVAVEGAVLRPGVFEVPIGTPLKKVLSKSRPKRFADMRKFDLDQGVTHSCAISVDELKEIVIRIEGAVEAPFELTLPVRTRILDLKGKISILETADPSIFKSRRMLLDGEVFTIPTRPIEQENKKGLLEIPTSFMIPNRYLRNSFSGTILRMPP